MNARTAALGILTAAALMLTPLVASAQVTSDVPAKRADAIVDLGTNESARLVGAEWRYTDAPVVDSNHSYAGPALKPSGRRSKTHDITPKAGAADFNDSSGTAIDPSTLGARRGPGKLSYVWYRVKFTVPEKLGNFQTTGSTAVFEIVVDDYAEVW